jgi:predicted regulator of Ras-like GTPase activity (Roadblock/LC7/MglB family)
MAATAYDRLFREIMTQIKGARGVQLISREGLVIQSLYADETDRLDLSTAANMFLSSVEHVLVSLRFNDMKAGIIQAENGIFLVVGYDTETYLLIIIDSDTPINVLMSQLQHILMKQVPRWSHS